MVQDLLVGSRKDLGIGERCSLDRTLAYALRIAGAKTTSAGMGQN